MKKNIVIELKSVTKEYILHHEKPTFSEQILKGRYTEKFIALDNISLKIYEGEKLGVIGKNGSGKTTLLKIIAGITKANRGTVFTKGKVVSLINLEAGFHLDLTGEENIYLNGSVIGMSKKEIKKKFDQIVAFADIGKFINSPLYTYSEGMKLRLGFAIATHSDADILILDEGLSVGDQDFQRKASAQIRHFFRANKTIIVVSHWLDFLRENTERVVWIEDQKIRAIGNTKIIDKYEKTV